MEETSTEKLIAYWTEEAQKMEDEMKAGNPNNRSFVDLYKPAQMLYNLMWMTKSEEFNKLQHGSSTK